MTTPDVEKLAEQLHEWYLEATEQPDAEYNYKAVVPYADLSDGQKAIDRYIAQKVTTAIEEAREEERKRLVMLANELSEKPDRAVRYVPLDRLVAVYLNPECDDVIEWEKI